MNSLRFKYKILFLLIATIFIGYKDVLIAQSSNIHENEWIPEELGDKEWKALVAFDSRRSFFHGRNVRLFGLKFGAERKGVHRFGIGFYSMQEKEVFTGITVDKADANQSSGVKYDVGFATLFYERVLYAHKRWQISSPVYLGGGNVHSQYLDTLGLFKPWKTVPFSVFGFGVQAQYKVLPWLAPGFGGGYRTVFDTSPDVRSTFQQPYYIIKISILLGELYRTSLKPILVGE